MVGAVVIYVQLWCPNWMICYSCSCLTTYHGVEEENMTGMTFVIRVGSPCNEGQMSEIIGSLASALNASDILLFDQILE